ncbi:alpha/beta-hydrolase [Didymella exigua CBS 183.55]|uniref:Alpha/beta-hydrolase n=1 Tax=Didymella exigua CBS 183.55 TaxID=1150837 RepID=A0A6A5RK07_9PLEO|nr:alpha/beta-hydrolase [Didymella exigua CBS 183.55]KAF1925887.1 alpha/beta-hydrolase [Didymella exigua CBS 183.55]
MPVNTLSVGAAVTPIVIETYILHYLNRGPLRQKPTAHISYHEGLELIRRFLHYASLHPVDELQAFTAQWVPVPHWVHDYRVEIPQGQLARSAQYINAQLGPKGIKAVGGPTWWQWRRQGTKLEAEWIEMKKDRDAREKSSMPKGQRIMLYVHGGAYFFGSVDEHRYQMQRHARKLQARVLAPRYRLAPQFPFPCGLMDCLAAYLHLLAEGHDPNTIVLAGDSAGGGMVLSMLVTLRDQGVPLPAGAILISPWVDLTHSFPSLSGDGKMDYIPAHGFLHKPSISWRKCTVHIADNMLITVAPPNADDLMALENNTTQGGYQKRKSSPQVSLSGKDKEDCVAQKEAKAERVRGYSVTTEKPDLDDILNSDSDTWVSPDGKYGVGPKGILSIQLGEERIEIKDQIQLYTANHLLTHPLVSPALQPSLGGLPPLLIQTGGGELLRDEQIYLAHKAARPEAYQPPPSNNQTAEEIEAQALRYKPTNVQLQVWDDLCHVAPTLSFTRPAKHMYRSIAQFGAWALARAQETYIDILDDDDISFVSTDSESADNEKTSKKYKKSDAPTEAHMGTDGIIGQDNHEARVGKAGDSLPAFDNHMIRQRVDRHGYIYALAPKEELVALSLPVSEVGVPKPGPVKKWMKASQQWNGKFAKQKVKVQQQRMKEMKAGFERFEGETPPPTALAGRRIKDMRKEKAAKKSWGMALWSLWGSKHDESTIDREQKADQTAPPPSKAIVADPELDGAVDGTDRSRDAGLAPVKPSRIRSRMRSRSRHSNVTDRGQINKSEDDFEKLSRGFSRIAPPSFGLAEATVIAPERSHSELPPQIITPVETPGFEKPGVIVSDEPTSPPTIVPGTDGTSTRPSKGGVAYPFSLKVDGQGHRANASTVTLQSLQLVTPLAVKEHKQLFDDIVLTPAAVHESKQLGVALATPHIAADPILPSNKQYFDAPGAGLFSGQWQPAIPATEAGTPTLERSGVERFETAQKDLSTLANADKKPSFQF